MSKEDIDSTVDAEDTSVSEEEAVDTSNDDVDMDDMEFTEAEVLGEESEPEEETAATEESEEEETDSDSGSDPYEDSIFAGKGELGSKLEKKQIKYVKPGVPVHPNTGTKSFL